VRLFVSLLVVIIVAGLLIFAFARPRKDVQTSGKLQVVATIFPLADWLREVGGDDVEVHCLVSGSSNPHHFDPSMKDATVLTKARAVFAVGLELDPWAAKLADNAANRDLKFFTTGKWIKPRSLSSVKTVNIGAAAPAEADEHADHDHDGHDHHGHDHGDQDPHYWLDPVRAKNVVLRMAEELGKLDEANAAEYRARAKAYAEKIDALNKDVSDTAKRIAAVKSGAQLVTFHDAYGYLFEPLGISVAAVIQVSPGVEPGSKDVTEAVRMMQTIGQKVVFSEPLGGAKVAQVIAEQLKPAAMVKMLDPLDSELSEAGKTYLERMRYNLEVIEEALK
jgi:ABC-type Zn uptake system ZnuABC Zn-binding protein ZnuA